MKGKERGVYIHTYIHTYILNEDEDSREHSNKNSRTRINAMKQQEGTGTPTNEIEETTCTEHRRQKNIEKRGRSNKEQRGRGST
jgi:hypothetical protein